MSRANAPPLAAEVPEPDDSATDLTHLWRSPGAKRWSRADRFAVAAAAEAWRGAGLRDARREGTVGVFFGGSTAAMAEGEDYFTSLVLEHEPRPSIRYLASHQINGPGDAVARHLGATGRVETLSSACASGGLALGSALDALRRGEVDVAVAGGSDSLCKLTYAGFNSLRAVDADLCTPFRAERDGLNLGEGAGMLILETVERALARGRTPFALLLGHGASCDAHHMTAPHPEGEGASRAVDAALSDAGLTAGDIAFINAHGTGTKLNDKAEGAAFARVFGERVGQIPLASTKALVGHYLGSSGAIEAVAAVLGLHHGMVHPTPGRGDIDPQIPVDLVRAEHRELGLLGRSAGLRGFHQLCLRRLQRRRDLPVAGGHRERPKPTRGRDRRHRLGCGWTLRCRARRHGSSIPRRRANSARSGPLWRATTVSVVPASPPRSSRTWTFPKWVSPRQARRMSPPSRLAVACARMAFSQAGLDEDQAAEHNTAVITSTSFGPSSYTEDLMRQIILDAPTAASAFPVLGGRSQRASRSGGVAAERQGAELDGDPARIRPCAGLGPRGGNPFAGGAPGWHWWLRLMKATRSFIPFSHDSASSQAAARSAMSADADLLRPRREVARPFRPQARWFCPRRRRHSSPAGNRGLGSCPRRPPARDAARHRLGLRSSF